MNLIIKKIKDPFPYTRGFVPEILSTLKVCLLATLIFFFFKPFGLEKVASSTILGFGLVVFLSALINIAISLYVIRPFINEEKWCVWKEIIRVLVYLTINIIAIILFAKYNFDINLNMFTIFKFIGFTIFLAIIPISIRVVSVNNWLLKNKLKEAQDLSKVLKDKKLLNDGIAIQLKSNIVNDIVNTNTKDLQFIEAEKNYITITELKECEPKKSLLRLSIIKALEQIEDENIIRCHRSYVVNLKAVISVTGNSQGFKLLLNESLKPVPVSRSYKKAVTEKLSLLE
ncbi:MAG: LytTR family DNA-binding domain-containing protein [Psychroserpens sp.]|uniref:LytTR family DNA-binding domain-containing protein n=1 Tax=Psychroserpens sp. TaxID=2020870 RepID=UPI003002F122